MWPNDPTVSAALTAVILAALLALQTWFQEWRREMKSKSARKEQAELNADRVVAKLSMQPPSDASERETPKEGKPKL